MAAWPECSKMPALHISVAEGALRHLDAAAVA
jgi:hypothetical protein